MQRERTVVAQVQEPNVLKHTTQYAVSDEVRISETKGKHNDMFSPATCQLVRVGTHVMIRPHEVALQS